MVLSLFPMDLYTIKNTIYRKIRVLCGVFCGTPPEKARFHF